jgi:hypothetical protein
MDKRLAIAISLFFLISAVVVSVPLVKAQSVNNITINPDGSVTGTNSIQQVGSTYFFATNITGNIQVEKSNIIINGSGFALDGKGTGGIDLTNDVQHETNNPTVSNVTIENLYVINGGVGTNGGGYDTFYDDYISGNGACIMLIGNCEYNNITYCTLISTGDEAIGIMEGASYNTITENNLEGVSGINMFLSANQTVDKNYWIDYSSKYTNATEIDKSGIGNQPYVYYSAQNKEPNGTILPIIYQDNHPLMKPVAIPLTGSSSPSPSPTVPELSWFVIVPLLISMFAVAVIVRHRKNR